MLEAKHPVGIAGVIVAEGGDSDRLALIPSTTVDNWYHPYNPRNQNVFAEGTWQMWVKLAGEILKLEAERVAQNTEQSTLS